MQQWVLGAGGETTLPGQFRPSVRRVKHQGRFPLRVWTVNTFRNEKTVSICCMGEASVDGKAHDFVKVHLHAPNAESCQKQPTPLSMRLWPYALCKLHPSPVCRREYETIERSFTARLMSFPDDSVANDRSHCMQIILRIALS